MLVLVCMFAAVAIVSLAASASAADEDFFPILPWDGLWSWNVKVDGFKDPVESVAACNFTIAGFVNPEQLDECKKLGLKAIIARPTIDGPGHKMWFGETGAEIDKSIKDRVAQSGKSDTVLGYFIVDEPGTPAFSALAKAVAAVRKYAPGKLSYMNLFPGYATIGAPDESQLGAASFAEYLEKFVAEVKPDILSYDNYKVMTSDNFASEPQAGQYFSDLIEVRRVSLEHNIPFWNVCCANRIRPYTTIPTPANLSLQAYTTLAAGGRGLSWYTYFQRGYAYAPLDSTGEGKAARTETWFYLQEVNRQVKLLGPMMNRLKSTGVYFTKPPAGNCAALPGKMVKSVESISSIKGFSTDSPAIMVGEFEGKDSDYVMLVNISLDKAANVKLQTQQAYAKREVVSAVDARLKPFDDTDGQWLVPGGGLLVKLTK